MTPPDHVSDEALQRQREAIRRGLVRTNTAAVLILLVVVGLAAVAVLEGKRAVQERARAVQAEQDARQKLWKSYQGEARGIRASLRAGRRFESLDALKEAARMRPTLELRNDAIASLTLADLRLTGTLPATPAATVALDEAFDWCAVSDARGGIQVRSCVDDRLELELPALTNAALFILPFSPDRRFLPVVYADGQTRLWDLEKKTVVLDFQLWWFFQAMDFSPDSRRLVVGEATGTLAFYDLSNTGTVRRVNVGFTRPWVRFSPDGRLVGVYSPDSTVVLLVEAENGRVEQRLEHPQVVRGLSWHPQGQIVATGCADEKLHLWQLGEPPRSIGILAGHQSSVMEVAFHPNGEWLVSNGWDGTTRLWDTATGQEAARMPCAGRGLSFNRDGSRLAFYPAVNLPTNGIQIYEVPAKRALRFLRESDRDVKEGGTSERRASGIWEANFSADERLLASAGRHGIRVWDLERGVQLAQLTTNEAFSAFFERNGEHLVGACDEGLLRWRLERLGAEVLFSKPEKLTAREHCQHAAVSEDGLLLAYSYPGQIELLGRQQGFPGWSSIAQYVAVSPDGRWLAASAWPYNGVRLWETETGKLVRELPTYGPADVAFSADSVWLAMGWGGEYCFYDVKKEQVVRRLPRNDMPEFHGTVAFSPDRKLVALVRSFTQVQLLDTVTFEEVARLESPMPQFISWLSFSRSGAQLAVGTETAFIQVWDLRWVRQQLAELGLDWTTGHKGNEAQLGSATAARAAPVLSSLNFIGNSRHEEFLLVTGSGVALAICLAIFVLRRHQSLVVSYQRLDELASQRARVLEAAQRDLLHSDKMKALGTLAAGIAHDFNNLLSVIRLSNDVIGREAGNEPSVREEVDSIENAVQQGRAVVRSMLGYSSQAADQPCAYAVGDVVADTVSLLSKQFLGGIVLTLDVERRIPKVQGIPSRLEQILLNLVVNAAEAMKGRGKLFVSVQAKAISLEEAMALKPRVSQEYVQVSVIDSGPGIEAEVLPRIFEPFFTTKIVGAAVGTGLGLSTVYTIAQQDGLGLAVETAVGQGTTFRVFIPVPVAESQSEN
jgi:signal transduction histidine kinase